jgi:hypothetical protein
MDMSEINKVEMWWYVLCVVSVLNIGAWFLSYRFLRQNIHRNVPEIIDGRITIAWLSLVYVLVCAFRSFLPRIDIERIVLVDHWLSSVLIGRTLTTFAEIFFIAQCALLLREAGRISDSRFVVLVSMVLIPVIIIAEGFSWYASLTTHYLASVFEESLWALSGFLFLTGLVSLWPNANRAERLSLTMFILLASCFLAFMIIVDVPMYWERYLLDAEAGKNYLSLGQGLQDLSSNYRVSFDLSEWRNEIPWMTLYFTVAVWVSIYLPHAIVFSNRKEAHDSGI